MSIEEIAKLPIHELSDTDCHLWLWTTNQFIRDGFHLMEMWRFKYLAPNSYYSFWVQRKMYLL